MRNLTQRETLFCRMYVSCRNGREAAFKAGYTVCPEITSKKLLSTDRIRKKIEEVENENSVTDEEIKAGLRRIAFSSSADAVKLLLSDGDGGLDIESLDLFNIAEIKKPKTGGLEIKFFDRIKALEKLGEFANSSLGDASAPFYSALEKSAAALGGGDK